MMPCPQCTSRACGPVRCRFSQLSHELFRQNQYSEAMQKSDQVQRNDGRSVHDMTPSGMPLKAGK